MSKLDRFDLNRFWLCKWNEKSDEFKTCFGFGFFGLSNGILPMPSASSAVVVFGKYDETEKNNVSKSVTSCLLCNLQLVVAE